MPGHPIITPVAQTLAEGGRPLHNAPPFSGHRPKSDNHNRQREEV